MFIKDLEMCEENLAGDNSILRELLNPHKDDIKINYSLAYAKVLPGDVTKPHKLKSSEVYYILQGEGEMFMDTEKENVKQGQAVYIPPNTIQLIRNTGEGDLIFLCIVDPAWKFEDEDVIK
ncbi:MAG: cupin domain-containing protein [Thermoplasmata archaeon]|nr:MAG: cupin domain-containing protein [Thermoplasmata archaeon]